ncbi:hypothetical protein [Chitinophaga flava]|uniref:hypothetical protein n=1 Tax=Chitinophaga flava TaxID=2259036 RepID=UPI001FE9B520|nr:hypothetical protein [Chitinophaga flava]
MQPVCNFADTKNDRLYNAVNLRLNSDQRIAAVNIRLGFNIPAVVGYDRNRYWMLRLAETGYLIPKLLQITINSYSAYSAYISDLRRSKIVGKQPQDLLKLALR